MDYKALKLPDGGRGREGPPEDRRGNQEQQEQHPSGKVPEPWLPVIYLLVHDVLQRLGVHDEPMVLLKVQVHTLVAYYYIVVFVTDTPLILADSIQAVVPHSEYHIRNLR